MTWSVNLRGQRDSSGLKDARANCFCASLLRTQLHTPRHAWSCIRARAKKVVQVTVSSKKVAPSTSPIVQKFENWTFFCQLRILWSMKTTTLSK